MPQKRTSGQQKPRTGGEAPKRGRLGGRRAEQEEQLLAAQGHYSREQRPHASRAPRAEEDEFARQGHYSREQRPR